MYPGAEYADPVDERHEDIEEVLAVVEDHELMPLGECADQGFLHRQLLVRVHVEGRGHCIGE